MNLKKCVWKVLYHELKRNSTLNYVLKYLDLVRNKIFKFIRRQDMLNK